MDTKLIEIVNTLQKLRAESQSTDEFKALSKAIDAVLQAEAFEDGERGRWIPVGERMPEQMGYYLTSRQGIVEKDVYSDFKRGFLHDGVEAWQPLPKAYEKGAKG